MGKIVEFLKGKKTYIQAAAGGVLVALFWAGVIDANLLGKGLALLGLGMGASIGAKIDRANAAQ